jgi:hypothetical protein
MAARSALATAAMLLTFGLLACSGERTSVALTEPLRVRNGSFKEGALPGALPVPPEAPAAPPSVTSFETASTVVRPGQSGRTLLGRTSTDAVAVAVRFGDLGSGYWVFPVDAPDPQSNGELTWQAQCDFGQGLPAGLHPMRVVAIDAAGHAGTQRELSLCVTSAVPDNLNACDPKSAPPAAVVSLSWDSLVDLDLVVVGPDGKLVDAKHAKTSLAAADAGVSIGVVDRDSNGACVIDGSNRENLVFATRPPAGSYLVYANLFDACGKSSAHFKLSLFEQQPNGDTTQLVETITKNGTVLALEANGGARLGTFVTEIVFP